ncbi:MAG: MBL fold metallo-hydrolase [Actinomycetales bacterium]|jgi:glyoxylase-like metal-dependent hydrolase (beta-lactamase superfamily II)|nr:MBL fold metallo-hydrolase [Candidatus Lutibacillus vidarii]
MTTPTRWYPDPAYRDDVHPGDPTSVRELDGLTVRKITVSAMNNCVYLLTCAATGEQLLIDAADDVDRLTGLVAEGSGRLDLVVTTHQHWDHTRALAVLLQRHPAPSAAGEDDADALPVPPTVRLRHGDVVTVGRARLDVIALRGHTPGSVALAYAEPGNRTHLFTGDSLFPGGVGNTTMPGQSFSSLYADVVERVFDRFGDDTWVYPGHGRDTALGVERPFLQEWRDRGW